MTSCSCRRGRPVSPRDRWTVPARLKDGAFTSFDCDVDFAARWTAATNTVRVRTHHGASEPSPSNDGTSGSGDGYVLNLAGKDGISLGHDGNVVSKG